MGGSYKSIEGAPLFLDTPICLSNTAQPAARAGAVPAPPHRGRAEMQAQGYPRAPVVLYELRLGLRA